jgi:hypothetical protein
MNEQPPPLQRCVLEASTESTVKQRSWLARRRQSSRGDGGGGGSGSSYTTTAAAHHNQIPFGTFVSATATIVSMVGR